MMRRNSIDKKRHDLVNGNSGDIEWTADAVTWYQVLNEGWYMEEGIILPLEPQARSVMKLFVCCDDDMDKARSTARAGT